MARRREVERQRPLVPAPRAEVLQLDDAVDAALAGNKAANLAVAAGAAIPVLPGFVLTTHAVAARWHRNGNGELRGAWADLSGDGTRPLVVRSSSPVEDDTASSMAGVFTSVIDVRGWPAFIDAVDAVATSAGDAPMAVLVQPWLDARAGGVMFGADPLTGRQDRVVVEATAGSPAALVSGTTEGSKLTLTTRGRVLVQDPAGDVSLSRAEARRLARLAGRLAELFGAPQDVEWAIDHDDALWLLQSRPVTALAEILPTRGPVLGPGPVAETFPDALAPLEDDLWRPSLHDALIQALRVSAATSRRHISRSPVIVSVDGRLAVDLALLGALPRRRTLWTKLDPRPSLHRLRAAWRVGRLRAALPSMAADLIEAADADLAEVPAFDTLADEALVDLLRQGRRALTSLHGHEILLGLVRADDGAASGVAYALRRLAEGRSDGLDDAEIVSRQPAVLGLIPPRIGPLAPLPQVSHMPATIPTNDAGLAPPLREALRLRVRWVHELMARVAWELGDRLAGRGDLESAGDVRRLHLDELARAVRGLERPVPAAGAVEDIAPLPVAFRLAADGTAVPVPCTIGSDRGRGVAGGRGMGVVAHATAEPSAAGAVLVVRTLDPALAAVLPDLAGLVAETGSALSHLAILAREFGVPAVVGVPDARTRFPEGVRVVVDGRTGEVTKL